MEFAAARLDQRSRRPAEIGAEQLEVPRYGGDPCRGAAKTLSSWPVINVITLLRILVNLLELARNVAFGPGWSSQTLAASR